MSGLSDLSGREEHGVAVGRVGRVDAPDQNRALALTLAGEASHVEAQDEIAVGVGGEEVLVARRASPVVGGDAPIVRELVVGGDGLEPRHLGSSSDAQKHDG